jgi:release factor glutamine methyltransferase
MPTTVGDLLRDTAARLAESGSESPRLDAEVLLGHVLRVDRATLLAGPEAGVGADAAGQFEKLVERRMTGEPVSYIRGIKEFYGVAFTVDARALIPRPETETLVDLALARIGILLTAAPRSAEAPLRIWDVGTGSGAIAVAIAIENRRRGYSSDVKLRATDVSTEALSLAVENAVVHGVADVIDFAQADLTEGADSQPVDLLLANLPYVATDVVPTLPAAASFEPKSALDGGPDGLDLIRRLIGQLPSALKAGGIALMEIGSDQVDSARTAALSLGDGWQIQVHDDLTSRPRILELTRAAA